MTPTVCRTIAPRNSTAKDNAHEVGGKLPQVGRPRQVDFRVTPGDQRVRVVRRMHRAAVHRLAERHEAGDPINGLVEPAAAERRPVCALVRRDLAEPIERAVERERRDRPHRSPRPNGKHPGADHQPHVHAEINEPGAVAPPRQLLQHLAVDLAAIPLVRGVIELHGPVCRVPASIAPRGRRRRSKYGPSSRSNRRRSGT